MATFWPRISPLRASSWTSAGHGAVRLSVASNRTMTRAKKYTLVSASRGVSPSRFSAGGSDDPGRTKLSGKAAHPDKPCPSKKYIPCKNNEGSNPKSCPESSGRSTGAATAVPTSRSSSTTSSTMVKKHKPTQNKQSYQLLFPT